MDLKGSSFEAQVHFLRTNIFELAEKYDVQSDVLVAALADVFGTAAAVLDKNVGEQRLQDRLGDLCQRIEATYKRVKTSN